jgi:hypothetical protein
VESASKKSWDVAQPFRWTDPAVSQRVRFPQADCVEDAASQECELRRRILPLNRFS